MTKGLCGIYNGNKKDDYTPRDQLASTDLTTFVLSWQYVFTFFIYRLHSMILIHKIIFHITIKFNLLNFSIDISARSRLLTLFVSNTVVN